MGTHREVNMLLSRDFSQIVDSLQLLRTSFPLASSNRTLVRLGTCCVLLRAYLFDASGFCWDW
jgi:hypothetical protein